MTTIASIYCDGACRGNGKRGAVGAWAWAYWRKEARGEPLAAGAQLLKVPVGGAATNQRAELTALLESMRFAAHHLTTPVTIYTDSLYSLNCMTTWGPSWKRKGWKRDSGEPLLNLDLIKPLVEIWALESKVRGWRVQHVRGHQTGSGPEVWGNNWVDRAAVAAAEGTPTDISLTAAAAAADTISHVEDDYVLARPSVPKPSVPSVPKPSVPAKQADIRMWFGFSP